MTCKTRRLSLALFLLGSFLTIAPPVAQTRRTPLHKPGKQGDSVPGPDHDARQPAMEMPPVVLERIDGLKSPTWKGRLKASLAQTLVTNNPEGGRQLFEQSIQTL